MWVVCILFAALICLVVVAPERIDQTLDILTNVTAGAEN
jgi:hypothetical protein